MGGYELRQRPAVDVLHGDERETINLADFVHGADVRVIQMRGGARFVEQAAAILRRRSRSRSAKQLERDRPMQPFVARAIHDAHGARAQSRLDAVMSQGLPDHRPPRRRYFTGP